MFKPPTNVIHRHYRESFGQRVRERALGPCLQRAEDRLELGDTFLKGIEVGGVRWEIENPSASRFHQRERLGRIMKLDVIEQDKVARAQASKMSRVE